MSWDVEHLQKAAKALLDHKTKPWQYCIAKFGYCTLCQKVTEYHGDYGLEGCFETCLGCRLTFHENTANQYLTGDKVSASVKAEIDKLHSRKHQISLFRKLLEEKLEELYQKRLKIGGDIAALISTHATIRDIR